VTVTNLTEFRERNARKLWRRHNVYGPFWSACDWAEYSSRQTTRTILVVASRAPGERGVTFHVQGSIASMELWGQLRSRGRQFRALVAYHAGQRLPRVPGSLRRGYN